ncbi:MAG: polysaccharide biosynthesis/export family protein [Bacteroidales bacterium]|nr:polysaccharide biosynthesis/export family protein [Bacteroidales bacterium]HOY39822.1 polysaccharide biosynthesis/export family protein [Bacteroidales bacterium]HQP04856.1 polysaccharide biosynthesis/export family protein [Bacteroidales bacterium]
MQLRLISIFFTAAVLMSLSSCKILRPTEMFKENKDYPISEFKPSEKEYRIKPFDILSIRITTNDGYSLIGVGGGTQAGTQSDYRMLQSGLEYLVEYDGLVKLPTLGRTNMAGFTIREAEQELETMYSEYYQNPFVLIDVTNRKVFVFYDGGTRAHTITIPKENITLVEAISRLGGLTDISRAYRIKLIRGDITNNPEVYYWNLSTLDELKETNLLLQANDVIYIDSKPQYVTKILKEIAPYLTLATTALSVYGIFFKK